MPSRPVDPRSTPHVRAQRVIREGLLAGAAGALLAAFTYGAFDVMAGNALRTPETIHDILLNSGLIADSGGSLALQLIQIVGLHVAVWVAAGFAIAFIVSYVDIHPRAWAGMFCAVAFVFLSSLYIASLLSSSDAAGLPLWAGTLAGSAALAGVLLRRHAGLLHHFEQTSLTEHTHRDIEVAYRHECRSRALYRAAHECWPHDATFDEMLTLSQKRVAVLEKLFDNYQCEIPGPDAEPEVDLPASPEETYRVAVRWEAKKADMYHQFLLSVDENQARNAFTHLQWDARDGSLPQLRRHVFTAG